MRPFVVNPGRRPRFVYEPLDTARDCIRLITIEPATNPTAPIECRLSHVSFSERPHYEAISYMWGDESRKLPVFINGKAFDVVQNLFDAMTFFRQTRPRSKLWVDAICISQDGVEEKNRQIRIMPHIYFRATKILVWLGVKRLNLSESSHLTLLYSEKEALKRTLPDLLFEDGYWDRLWVVQELGKADQIQACYQTRYQAGSLRDQFENFTIDWNTFIQNVNSHLKFKICQMPLDGNDMDPNERGPLRLDKQLRGKYHGGSHSLRSLLETHHNALCQNPRDKVYGLAGLADD